MIRFDDSHEVPFPKEWKFSRNHFYTLKAVGMLPLSSEKDLEGLIGVDQTLIGRRLGKLEEPGAVSYYKLGATKPMAKRFYATPEGRNYLQVPDALWSEDWALARLLELLPQVEWFYPAASSFLGALGPLLRFRWFRGLSWDAAALFEKGWVAFFWSGIMEGEIHIRERFNRLGLDLDEYNVRAGRCFPSVLCFVVSDAWQGELVMQVARSLSLDDRLQIWRVDDGSVSGIKEPGEGRGWVVQITGGGSVGGWPVADRVKRSFWSQQGGNTIYKLLDATYEWPGLSIGFGEHRLQQADGTGWASRHNSRIYKAGLVRRYKANGAFAYVLDNKGFDLLGRRDRRNLQRPRKNSRRSKGPEERGMERHERGLMNFITPFYDAGISATNGSRYWEHLGDAGIAPDGLVWLERGPLGPGWYYVEYELRARTLEQAIAKLWGYRSPSRRDTRPLLLIARDERMEAVFQVVGWRMGIRMLTTTVGRLSRFSPLEQGCWSFYGAPFALDEGD